MATLNDGRASHQQRLDEYNQQGCVERVAQVGFASLLVGAFAGAVTASWKESMIVAPRTTYWRAIRDVSRGLSHSAGMFGIAGVAFAVGDCGAQTFRGKSDWANQAVGGCLAGVSLGLATKSLPGAVGGCFVLGGLSAFLSLAPLVENHALLKK